MTTQQQRQIYKTLRVGDDAANQLDGRLSYGILPFLAMMHLWLACSFENITGRSLRYLRAIERKALQDAADIASGKTRAPALIPESERVAEAPKIMLGRREKRILARGLPASRRYDWFRYASPRTLNGNQFFELLGRISGHGRASIYRLEYKARLCKRRPKMVLMSPVGLTGAVKAGSVRRGVSAGLSSAHLWPN